MKYFIRVTCRKTGNFDKYSVDLINNKLGKCPLNAEAVRIAKESFRSRLQARAILGKQK